MKKTLLLGIALFIASLNLRPAINSVSPLLQTIRDDLGINAFAASLLTSIPVLCMGIFPPLAVKLGHRQGMERVIGWSLLIIGAGTILRLFASSAAFLLVTALIAGIGIAAIGPLLSGFIKRYFPSKVPVMISLYSISLALGATLASGLSVPLQARMQSWQSALAVWAVLAAIAVPVWWLSVLRNAQRPVDESGVNQSAKLPWKSRKAWLLTLSFGFLGILFYSITAWLPPMIQSMGYGKAYAANALTLFSVVQIPVGMTLPILLKRYPSRLLWLLLGSLLVLSGLLMIAFSIQPWLAAILIGMGPGVLFPINLLLPIDAAEDAEQAAAWSAMTQSVGYIIGALGPVLLGWLHDATGSFSILIAGMIAANLLMIVVHFAAVRPTAIKPGSVRAG